MMRASGIACALVLSLVNLACSSQKPQVPLAKPYKTIAQDPRRNTQLAGELNAKAVKLIHEGRLDSAQKELTSALTADMFFGPAHNNLGTVYYRQKKYYLAAWEFQYAANLMPGKSEPKGNLGMVFEAAGKLDDAAKYYEEALKIDPDDIEATGNLARVYVIVNRKDDRTRKLLEGIVMRDDRAHWVAWARERLAIMGSPRPSSQPVETK